MTLLHPTTERVVVAALDAEALIREARRLRRRRWMFACLVFILVIGGTVLGLVATGGVAHPKPRTMLVFHAGRPTVDAKAFAGEGDLAFVSRNVVYVLDGATKALVRLGLPAGFVPGSPSFSSDGKWLAIPATRSYFGESTQSYVWLADADGKDLHELTGFDNPASLGWSPTADLLAVTNEGKVPTYLHSPRAARDLVDPTSLWLVTPRGARRELVRPGSGMIDGATWSPDGSAVAVGGLSAYPFEDRVPWAETLTTYPVDGSKPTVWLRIVNPKSNSCCDTVALKQSQFIPVGWWAHWGIVFWGASADIGSAFDGGGLPLFAIPTMGAKPILLGQTAADGAVSTLVASGNGRFAISNNSVDDGTRPFWQHEQVLQCDPKILSCTRVTTPPGTISFDPVWSPDGSKLAYLVGKELNVPDSRGGEQKFVSSWYDSLQLWQYTSATKRSTEVRAAKGAVIPIWSADSKSLMYVQNDGVWLQKTLKGQPREVAGPLLPPQNWSAFYAEVHWAGTFAWSRSQYLPQPDVLTRM